MHAILTVFAKEFRENLRERRTLFSALILGPLLGSPRSVTMRPRRARRSSRTATTACWR